MAKSEQGKAWDDELVKSFVSVLENVIFGHVNSGPTVRNFSLLLLNAHDAQRPTGLVMHIADIYIRELVKRTDVPQGVVIALFRPFAEFIGHTNEFAFCIISFHR